MVDKRKAVNVSLRLPKSTHDTLELIAHGERVTVSEIIRLAIEQYLNPEQKGKT